MPRPHREFLAYVDRTSNLRSYVFSPAASSQLVDAYNAAVEALASLRDIHIQIVARYIVMPSRCPPAAHVATRKGKNLATACSKEEAKVSEETNASATRQLHGTGGTSVMPFLRKTRDETRAATVVPGAASNS
jgi:indoleamine 2,3-dioxygenase